MNEHKTLGWLGPALWVAFLVVSAAAGAQDRPVGHPTFLSPHASPIVASRGHVFVVNTPADTVDVIQASSRAIVTRVNVGFEPTATDLQRAMALVRSNDPDEGEVRVLLRGTGR